MTKMDQKMAGGIFKATEAKCVIFDLDGTLVDTAPDLLATLNLLFTRRGHREITLGEVRNVIGQGAKAMIAEGGQLTGNVFNAAPSGFHRRPFAGSSRKTPPPPVGRKTSPPPSG